LPDNYSKSSGNLLKTINITSHCQKVYSPSNLVHQHVKPAGVV